MSEASAGSVEDGGNDLEQQRARRQQRLRSLRSSRPALAGAGLRPDASATEDPGPRRRILERAVRVLTRTPADADGVVPGTSFTQAGVAALMAALQQRVGGASSPGGPGSKAATRVLEMLAPSAEDGADIVHGASVRKLQRLSRIVERLTPGVARPAGGADGPRRA